MERVLWLLLPMAGIGLVVYLLMLAADTTPVAEAELAFRRRCSPLTCGDVFQLEYPDAGVTCWLMVGSEKGGISCLATGGAR